ncbi:hypothetical protein niasHT_005842 [Heterodera trifolii]|uniref:Uncharacterized protein n=1 Tax=Heterodera trifolii TaxID=157864 RepID=A0ABD2MFA0_9BILA
MGMLILLFLTAFFGFPTFLLSVDKAYVTEPFLLTRGNIGKVSVPYFALDQCKPYHSITHDPKAESRNFGLYFMMKHRGGHCDDGILICYPGTLMRNHMTSEFKKIYIFEPMTRQLSLNFGTRVSMFTWVTTHFGQPFHDEEFDLAEQYVNQMGYGPFLEQHVGLWLLGMDMLPWMAEEFVSLYVYRNCSCTMDAWFTRPTDENDPIEPIVPSAGSSQCPTKQMDEIFEVVQLEAQHLQADLVFTVLTDEEWQNFTVELLQQEEEGTNLTMVMNFTIGTIDVMNVSFPGINASVVNGTQMPNGTQQLRFDIFLLKHWFVIMVNGVQFGEVFWPNEWWHGAAWKNITAIRLNGQVLLLYGPELDDYRIENENFNISVALPFSQQIEGFRVNSTFFFRVQLLNETHNTVNITFTDGKSNDIIAQMEFKVDAGGDGKQFFCLHKLPREGIEKLLRGQIQNNSLKILSIRRLSLHILMAEDGFYGRISTQHDYIKLCPYYGTTRPWTIDHIRVEVPNVNLTVNDIRVEQADPDDARETVRIDDLETQEKRIEWTRIKYLKINQTFGGTDDTFFVFVNLLLAKQLNTSSKIHINFFNQGLEFHHFFGRTVNHITLLGGKWLGFFFIDQDTKEWRAKVNYTLSTVIEEDHPNTVTPNSDNQRANRSTTMKAADDHKPLDKQIELKFKITMNLSSRKIGVEFRLNDQHITKDINGNVLTCCPAEAVPFEDIQYITANSFNMDLSPDTDVQIYCVPPEKCILKT